MVYFKCGLQCEELRVCVFADISRYITLSVKTLVVTFQLEYLQKETIFFTLSMKHKAVCVHTKLTLSVKINSLGSNTPELEHNWPAFYSLLFPCNFFVLCFFV